ncbi:hypothetical protein GGR57DRAFT_100675 [Xylariaceae sp. FL1272]|nr:hypothetical protein GGR57DRAFT_100675 [Xylariaceae sp. FL1272]
MTDPKEPQISTSFIAHLRQAARLSCPIPGYGETVPSIDDRIRDHLQSQHPQCPRVGLDNIVRDLKGGRIPQSLSQEQTYRDISSVALSESIEDGVSTNKRRSPTLSVRARSDSPGRRSRARARRSIAAEDPDFLKRVPQQGKLWKPEQDTLSPRITKSPAQQRRDEDSEALRLIKQPETRPISQEQLVAEVESIYAGLVMVESKCIEVDNAKSSTSDTEFNNEQWQALIALHRILMRKHHDFFLSSQHPSARPAFRQLASKYVMPAKIWRHSIHSFVELLRHRLPESLDHMMELIYLAYSMMAFLYETVPAFEDTWIECLGDLGRYRGKIEDEDIPDREVWPLASKHWYSHVLDYAPTTGRLYHHLAILARPRKLQQLFYYTKSLRVPQMGVLSNTPGASPDPTSRWNNWVTSSSILRLITRSSSILRFHSILCVLSIPCLATAAVTKDNASLVLHPDQTGTTSDGSRNGHLSWLLYPGIVASLLVGEFVAAHILGDPLLLHGVSMAISAGAFLLMALNQHEVPLQVQFSTWGMCTISTIAWLYYDTLPLRHVPDMRRLAVFIVIVCGFILDSVISNALSSASNSIFPKDDSPSTAFLFATFLLPSMALSAFLRSGIHGAYHHIRQNLARTNDAHPQFREPE